MPEVNIFKNVEETVRAVADRFVTLAGQSIAASGKFNLALSGGSSPEKLYQLLASDSYRNKVDWLNVYFFFGDERYVPPDDENSNARMVMENLFQPLFISPSKIFKVDTSLPPDEAAKDYEQKIKLHFNSVDVNFDLVLLGLGDNAHTASLFPHTDILHETYAGVRAVYVEELNAFRISMTAPLINQAHNILFLVYGKSKASAVNNVLHGSRNFDEHPAQLVAPVNGVVEWYLDADASKVDE